MSSEQIDALCSDLRNWNRCKEAIRSLSRMGTPAIPALFRLLHEEEWRIRDRAVQALVGMRLAAVPDLCQLVSAGNLHARWDAIHALGLIRDTRAVPYLCHALQDDDIIIRYKAIEGLEDIGDAGAVSALCEALREEHSGLRRQAAHALGNLDRASAVCALCAALEDTDAYVRRSAAESLRKLSQDKALPRKILGERSMNPEARVQGLQALSRVSYVEKGDALFFHVTDVRVMCQLAQVDHDMEVREGAREVLEWLNKRNTLLRPSHRPLDNDTESLLRSAESASSLPDTLLRPVEKDSETAPVVTEPPAWWERWWKRP